jgi:hypothetical protein
LRDVSVERRVSWRVHRERPATPPSPGMPAPGGWWPCMRACCVGVHHAHAMRSVTPSYGSPHRPPCRRPALPPRTGATAAASPRRRLTCQRRRSDSCGREAAAAGRSIARCSVAGSHPAQSACDGQSHSLASVERRQLESAALQLALSDSSTHTRARAHGAVNTDL